jgi:hypothetical protein
MPIYFWHNFNAFSIWDGTPNRHCKIFSCQTSQASTEYHKFVFVKLNKTLKTQINHPSKFNFTRATSNETFIYHFSDFHQLSCQNADPWPYKYEQTSSVFSTYHRQLNGASVVISISISHVSEWMHHSKCHSGESKNKHKRLELTYCFFLQISDPHTTMPGCSHFQFHLLHVTPCQWSCHVFYPLLIITWQRGFSGGYQWESGTDNAKTTGCGGVGGGGGTQCTQCNMYTANFWCGAKNWKVWLQKYGY